MDRSSFTAALLLLGQELFPEWPGTAADTLQLVGGADESETNYILEQLRDFLPTVLGADHEPAPPAVLDVWEAVHDYYAAHPGSFFCMNPEWRFAGCCASDDPALLDGVCRFILGLAAPGQPGAGMSVAELASACQIAPDTLENWLRSQPL